MVTHPERTATALVVTSINPPTKPLCSLATGCIEHGWDFIVTGDTKSPAGFALDGCRFLSIEDQRKGDFHLGRISPERSYTRKNIGYLEAIRNGASVIVETDDDNHPRENFWTPHEERVECRLVRSHGWVNVYRYFTNEFIYPRGLPLCHARDELPKLGESELVECGIQQGLADHDPDVDAIYRMLFPLPFDFDVEGGPVMLEADAWCPFNSQNTTFFENAFPLLYLPAGCSFRMTDIWRSFVAQRVMQAQGSGIMFHGPTLWQERNKHDLQRDFSEEVVGYLNNAKMREALMALPFKPDDSIRAMMERCYETLLLNGWVASSEEALLTAWFDDLESCTRGCAPGL